MWLFLRFLICTKNKKSESTNFQIFMWSFTEDIHMSIWAIRWGVHFTICVNTWFSKFSWFLAPAGSHSVILDTFSAQLRKSKCSASLGCPWTLSPRSALCFSLLRIRIETFVKEICEDMSREVAMLRDSRVAENNGAGDLIQRQSSLASWILWLAS